MITVGELIERLSKMDPNTNIAIAQADRFPVRIDDLVVGSEKWFDMDDQGRDMGEVEAVVLRHKG